MIRPLHVLDTDQFAGTEQHVLTLVRAQARLGQTPVLACRRQTQLFAEASASPGVAVMELPGPLSSPKAVAGLIRAATRHSADLLHAHNGHGLMAGVLAGATRRLPVVLTQHFLEPAHTNRRGVRRLVSDVAHRICAAGTSQVIAISKAARDRMIARGECDAGRVIVVPNGVADPRLRVHRSPAVVRQDLGIAEDVPLIVTAARLEIEKGLDMLILAMRQVIAAEAGTICLIAGRGSQQDRLLEQINHSGLSQNVRLLGFRDDVAEIMNAADLFVLPSPAEPFGLVLLEAMALAKPVIACAAGGPLEIVEPGETGWLVPPGDDASLARAILQALKDTPQRLQMGSAARARYEQRFTDDQMARNTAAAYDRATTGSPVPSPDMPAEG